MVFEFEFEVKVIAKFDRRVKTLIAPIPPLEKCFLSEIEITPIVVSLTYFPQSKDGHIFKSKGGNMRH